MTSQSSLGKRVKSGQSSEEDALACSVWPVDSVNCSSLKEGFYFDQCSLLSGKLFAHLEGAEQESA